MQICDTTNNIKFLRRPSVRRLWRELFTRAGAAGASKQLAPHIITFALALITPLRFRRRRPAWTNAPRTEKYL